MCGLAGFSGHRFSFPAAKIITLLQEDRGRTSVGFLIGTYYFKDMGAPDAFFKKWIFDWPKNAKIAFVHNRMPSKGLSTKENAHPFVYNFIDEKGKERKAYFAHNGTIRNCDELCEEYNIEKTKFDTDSELLGYIITHHGFNVLSKYKGAAAFFYTREDQPNVLYVWKGASKQATETIEEERSLFFANVKEGVYFASTEPAIRTALDLNRENPATCFPDNTLIAYKEGNIVFQQVFDRSHIPAQPAQNYMGYNRGGQGGSHAPFSSSVNKDLGKTVGKHQKLQNRITFNSENPEPDRRKLYPKDNIYYQSGKFYCDGKLLNGEIRIDESGCVLSPDEYTFWNEGGDGGTCKAQYRGNDDGLNFEIPCEELFFSNGIWLKDRDSWLKFTGISKSAYENEINFQQKQYLHPDTTHFIYGTQNTNTLCLYTCEETKYSGVFHIKNRFSDFEYIVDIGKGNFYCVKLEDLDDPAIDKPDVIYNPAEELGFTTHNFGVEDTGNNMSQNSDLQNDHALFIEFIEGMYKDYSHLENDPTLNEADVEALEFIKALYVLANRKDLIKEILNEAPF